MKGIRLPGGAERPAHGALSGAGSGGLPCPEFPGRPKKGPVKGPWDAPHHSGASRPECGKPQGRGSSGVLFSKCRGVGPQGQPGEARKEGPLPSPSPSSPQA